MTREQLIDVVLDADCNDLTVGDCFDEEEIIIVINKLTNRWKIGDCFGEIYFDKDVDTILNNLN